ncbi:bifunctional transcriptional activator/DNA repair enzyme AdaA [Streptococcus dentasini]
MITDNTLTHRYYRALVERDIQFDGIFFAAIKTTGVFCHATCRARKPKFENCLFYRTAEEALLAGYRPCKICCPLSYPQQIPDDIKVLVDAVESDPEKHWREEDFRELGLHSATARRKFKDYYHMTFVQYARSRRMGLAFKEIQEGSKVIDQQLAMGYQSSSGFNDAFTKIMGNPAKKTDVIVITASFIMTPIGRMLALADDNYLYLLEFDNRRGLEKELEKLRQQQNARIIHGHNMILEQLKKELEDYFKGLSADFTIPLYQRGTGFQRSVWKLLQEIPVGETRSYKDLALSLGDSDKVRAVGNANGANQISILIPCHRVIAANGDLGGYGGGIERKRYLLALEQKIISSKH